MNGPRIFMKPVGTSASFTASEMNPASARLIVPPVDPACFWPELLSARGPLLTYTDVSGQPASERPFHLTCDGPSRAIVRGDWTPDKRRRLRLDRRRTQQSRQPMRSQVFRRINTWNGDSEAWIRVTKPSTAFNVKKRRVGQLQLSAPSIPSTACSAYVLPRDPIVMTCERGTVHEPQWR